jgi:pSer/pThr/pTyr-binding forkhead associated (FHA) protein
MDFQLVVRQGGPQRVLHLRKREAILGRARGNAVRIPSAEVSRRHCRLWQEGGLLFVEDLESVNGTFLNGESVRQRVVVRPGDHLEVGPVTFTVEYELTGRALEQLRGEEPGTAVLDRNPPPRGEFAEVADVVFDEDSGLAPAALEQVDLDFDFDDEAWQSLDEDGPPAGREQGRH